MATTKNIELYNNKLAAVKFIINSTRQGVEDTVAIKRAAAKIGINEASVAKAWLVYQETAGKLVDYRFLNGCPKLTKKNTSPLHKDIAKVTDTYTAGAIIKEFLTTQISIRSLCEKHQISENTYYKWIYELNTKGSLLGRKVLDYTKYSKKNIKDIIIFCKPKKPGAHYPEVKNIDEDYALYIGQVLKKYLVKK